MIIPTNIITSLTKSSPHSFVDVYYYNNSGISNENVILVLLSMLHFNDKINDDKLKAMFKGLRNGTLLRGLNTHHCKINNKWYNDISMFNVLVEAYNEVCPKNDMKLNDFLKYLNLYYNANKNYCINKVYSDFVEPLISNFESLYSYDILINFGVIEISELYNFDTANDKGLGLDLGYCCEDCDGNREQYKRSRYDYYHKDSMIKNVTDKFKSLLLANKTHNKNPHEKLK